MKLTLKQFNDKSDYDKQIIIDNVNKLAISMTNKEISNELNISSRLIFIILNNTFDKISYSHFKTLNDDKKQEIIHDITTLITIDGLNNNEIFNNSDYDYSLITHIKQEFKLKIPAHKKVEKIKRTNLEKYGVENVFQSKEVKEKIKQDNIEKFGVEYNFQRADVIDKIKQTKLERYGDAGYHNIEKMKETDFKKYGGYHISNEQVREKIKCTNLNKHGAENVFQSDVIKNKISNTIQEKYGVPWYCMTEHCILAQGEKISKINKEFSNLLTDNGIEHSFEYPIDSFSFDFKVGNILIEINPTYTHNSTIGAWFNHDKKSQALDMNYHYNKSILAKNNNLHCIHVWDWDDWNKIINLLTSKTNIGARQCEIKEVSKHECDTFLNTYHLQNTCKGQKVRLGLYYNNCLVQIMTFGEPRYNKNYEWELLRLCSHKDYKIIGGSQKLFKHFLKNYNPDNIISYCDNSKFTGRVYETLGMVKYESTKPSCNWSKGKQKITQNLLNQRGFDQLFKTNYGKNTSNKQLMIEHGWLEVFDCGQNTFIYNKEVNNNEIS